MQENNSIIIAMLEELLTISKSQRPEQTVNANVDLTPIKELIESSNKHREQAENDLQKVVAIMSGDVEMIHRRVKEVRAVIGNSQSTGKIQESVEETKTLVQKLKTTIEEGVHNFKHYRIGFETPFVIWTIVIETVFSFCTSCISEEDFLLGRISKSPPYGSGFFHTFFTGHFRISIDKPKKKQYNIYVMKIS